MDAALRSRTRRPGISRLAEHCEAFRRLTAGPADAARSRLEHELGPELAARLVGALAGPHGRAVL